MGLEGLESVLVSHAQVNNMFVRESNEVLEFETWLKERLERWALLNAKLADLNAWYEKGKAASVQ